MNMEADIAELQSVVEELQKIEARRNALIAIRDALYARIDLGVTIQACLTSKRLGTALVIPPAVRESFSKEVVNGEVRA